MMVFGLSSRLKSGSSYLRKTATSSTMNHQQQNLHHTYIHPAAGPAQSTLSLSSTRCLYLGHDILSISASKHDLSFPRTHPPPLGREPRQPSHKLGPEKHHQPHLLHGHNPLPSLRHTSPLQSPFSHQLTPHHTPPTRPRIPKPPLFQPNDASRLLGQRHALPARLRRAVRGCGAPSDREYEHEGHLDHSTGKRQRRVERTRGGVYFGELGGEWGERGYNTIWMQCAARGEGTELVGGTCEGGEGGGDAWMDDIGWDGIAWIR
ncbi:hypothetical protein EJ04DRAFT_337968 [Polyplosphaeria fusca]|uniref:Uncharacterized protein n=1 Tax=Polyplosphaeria fusca TaxID=682080 RepID=A0A9P4QW43_9PLEO|nr:hypothetical protein EJ04DRAFT_337968 [Polyplosphaeria fusca]